MLCKLKVVRFYGNTDIYNRFFTDKFASIIYNFNPYRAVKSNYIMIKNTKYLHLLPVITILTQLQFISLKLFK